MNYPSYVDRHPFNWVESIGKIKDMLKQKVSTMSNNKDKRKDGLVNSLYFILKRHHCFSSSLLNNKQILYRITLMSGKNTKGIVFQVLEPKITQVTGIIIM